MIPRLSRLVALGFFSAVGAFAADRFTIVVKNPAAIARAAETISLPWRQVNARLPHALIQHIAVKDAAGHALPFQVTNVNPEAKDPHNIGVAYGELLFQHDFAAGEQEARFTVERTEAVAPPFPTKVFARYVPERLDDFAWENDRIAHRTYGPALAAPDSEHRGKEVLVTSGLDVWCKRVTYPVVDRWYNKGHDHYHHDEGEGMDMYGVGTSRGCGGTGIWNGRALAVGGNYRTWRVVANGPIRAIFELSYDGWDANGTKVSEVKRFTVDAGHNFDCIDSTFTFSSPATLTAAIGINKDSADRGEKGTVEAHQDAHGHALRQWEAEKHNGGLGEAVIVPGPAFAGFAADAVNQLALVKVESGKPVRYYVGAGWTKSGQFDSAAAWDAYVSTEVARVNAPIEVTVSE